MNMIKTSLKYFRIWWLYTIKTSQIAFTSRLGALIFIVGKLLRLVFFIFFIYLLFSDTKALGAYSFWEIIFFFLTFNLIDTIAQFLMREVYRFRSHVVSGNFDYILLKPISSLFRSLFGGSDALDIAMIGINIPLLIYAALQIGPISSIELLLYILLVLNALVIAVAFHIFVISLGIMTTEVDNAIMLYRDVTLMGRLPVTVYQEPLRGLITFVIPVGIMMTFPSQALLGELSSTLIIVSFIVGGIFLSLALSFWKHALKSYTSASS